MSSSRGGIFSLNRLLGRKNKNEKSSENHLTKSTVQTLTRSTTNLEVIGPQNQIKPLASVNNAPFEQTFRITVSLPHGQLYVARIGAKTKLSDLLGMISTNKLLDANKFEFRHPTDDEQVYDLSCTIGEVGLNEIKLVPKHLSASIKEKTTIKYRSHNELRPAVRPHTMSSVSPYSSTNSLNSSDSSGIVSHSRSGISAAPNRKKRAAPRPPSQNSIPENVEKTVPKTQNDDDKIFKKPLLRQDFHVSSPNLTSNNNNNNVSLRSSTCNGSSSSFNQKYDETNYKKSLLNRPLSMHRNGSNSVDDQQSLSIGTNSNGSRNHSRTSSETSDITNNNVPEPAQRKKIPTPKKKAPIPPPRTISAMTTGKPKTFLQNLNEEQMESEQVNGILGRSSIDSSEVQTSASSPEHQKEDMIEEENHMPNVSKIMLNIDENGNEQHMKHIPTVKMQTFKGLMNGAQENIPIVQSANISKTRITYQNTPNSVNANEANISAVPVAKTKKTLVVSLNMEHNGVSTVPSNETNGNSMGHTDRIDTENVSEQINEIIEQAVDLHQVKMNEKLSQQIDDIIDQAVGIKESKLNDVNELKNIQNEINNNTDDEGVAIDYDSKAWNSSKTMLNGNIDQSNGECSSGEMTPVSSEVPIKPILNETRSFEFMNEYSDHSLATSTTSTTNTMETPSTGPDSIITSDIEDGYKGNEYDKQQKVELNREEFIEKQFGFLSEHLDAKTGLDSISDDDKNFAPIESQDVMSSTMIECKKPSSKSDKVDVINELRQMINCNRLETFMRPCNDDRSNVLKRSSLSNFHIGAYTNGNHENVKTLTIPANEQQPEGHAVNDHNIENKEPKITSVIPKQVNRSRSFHSTFANAVELEPIEQNNSIHLSLAPRSTSFVSLVSIQKQENPNEIMPTENELKKNMPQKSSSELSIADSPLLQSLEVMKSILSTSLNFDRMLSAEKKPVPVIGIASNVDKGNEEKTMLKNVKIKPEEVKPTIKSKMWKYEGPPAINLSTWGERPKSDVFIKSDNDYIFGGVSKMAALQKRFSAIPDDTETKKSCEQESCKLPIVRGFEYKKNITINSNGTHKPKTIRNNSHDLVDEVAVRPNYEISRIVSEKPFSVEKSSSSYDVMTLNRMSNPKPVPQKPNEKYSSLHRPHSLILQTNSISNVGDTEAEQSSAVEKPMFSQFSLRKTGLKEKFLDDNNSKNVINNNGNARDVNKSIFKSNPIPTAPKPPPMLKPKTLKKSISMGSPAADDPHNLLLDSIRNFNRNSLKRNCLV